MTKEEYINKLRRFNSTEKYILELDFLLGLIQPYPNNKIIDYGCGVGTAVKYYRNITQRISFMGFDIVDHVSTEKTKTPLWFIQELENCDVVYFLHSFAHIPNISKVLLEMREKVKKKVIVITPNAQWLRLQINENYIPDPTVVMHYTHDELVETFEDVGFKISISGQFGIRANNQHERLFLVAKP
jgi:ubiquinone/menaquinone biosynthesis C-methylase UbiE